MLEDTGPVSGGAVLRWNLPRAEDLADVWKRLYRTHEGCVFTPSNDREFAALMAGVCTQKTGRCAVLIDEWTVWGMHSSYTPRPLRDGIRMHRHLMIDWHITTQAPQDLEARIRNCMTHVWAFRNTDLNAQKVLVQWFPDVEGFGVMPDKAVRKWPI